jgi:hypothetical protein
MFNFMGTAVLKDTILTNVKLTKSTLKIKRK